MLSSGVKNSDGGKQTAFRSTPSSRHVSCADPSLRRWRHIYICAANSYLNPYGLLQCIQ
jgi:hypothetical protein